LFRMAVPEMSKPFKNVFLFYQLYEIQTFLTSFYDLTGRTFDVVITVVPPKVTLSIVVEAAGLGIGKLWLQPGSEDEAVIEKCVSLGLDFVSGSCIMLEK